MRSDAVQALKRIALGLGVVAVSFALSSLAVHLWSAPLADNDNLIHITEATYGDNCRGSLSPTGRSDHVRSGNATAAAAQSCDNTDVLCPVLVDVVKLGDPARGCNKDFSINWRCGAQPPVHRRAVPAEAHGAIVWLSCPATD